MTTKKWKRTSLISWSIFQENVLSLNISSSSSFSPSYSFATVGHNNVSTVTVVSDNCPLQQQQQQQQMRGRSVLTSSLSSSNTPLQPPEEGSFTFQTFFDHLKNQNLSPFRVFSLLCFYDDINLISTPALKFNLIQVWFCTKQTLLFVKSTKELKKLFIFHCFVLVAKTLIQKCVLFQS